MEFATAYFLKRYYPHVIKWWVVVYNPEVVRIWPSKAEKEAALRLEAKETKEKKPLALEQHDNPAGNTYCIEQNNCYDNAVDSSAYNAATGSYSGLYGQKPVDEKTQAALDAILNRSSNQNSVDSLLSRNQEVAIPPDQNQIITEANTIYERLLREAAEDEAKKQSEIAAARSAYEQTR